jgi:hypothetical protein
VGERPYPYENSCGTTSRVNEYNEKLNTSIAKKKDKRRVIFIVGFNIFLPSRQGEASIFL